MSCFKTCSPIKDSPRSPLYNGAASETGKSIANGTRRWAAHSLRASSRVAPSHIAEGLSILGQASENHDWATIDTKCVLMNVIILIIIKIMIVT